MGHGGFTQQELRDIFNLDPERQEDRPAIAAVQASSTRLWGSRMLHMPLTSGDW
jgi:hypothetical protein